jgi:hypothetical protein
VKSSRVGRWVGRGGGDRAENTNIVKIDEVEEEVEEGHAISRIGQYVFLAFGRSGRLETQVRLILGKATQEPFIVSRGLVLKRVWHVLPTTLTTAGGEKGKKEWMEGSAGDVSVSARTS